MARLEAQAKLLYYPTDLELVNRIATWFRVEGETRLIDPCCGKGDALARFAAYFEPKPATWGIELSYARVEAAQHSLDIVHNASFYDMTPPGRWADRSVSLAFNNPPYDFSHLEELRFGGKRKVRHEVNFIERLQPKLVEGGQQVIIIPRGILGDPLLLGEDRKDRIARHLLGWYEQVMVYRAENQDWERFSQVVVLALNKRAKYQAPGKDAVEALMAYADENVEIPILPEGDGSYLIPPAPKESKFQYKPVLPEDLVRIGKVCSPIGSPEFRRITYVRPLGAPFQPATPLKLGHITMLISGQETGVLRLKNKHDQAMLVKGMSRKMADVEADEAANQDGEYTHTNVTQKERHVTTLAIVGEDGGTELLSDPGRVGGFITEYAGVIADAILQRNEPLYNWLPQESEMAALDGIAVGLPPLPGRAERGLFLTQKHFVIGATRVMKKHRHNIVNAEMGFGKCSVTIGALHLLNKFPALVMCPGHMVFKWQRDIQQASDPQSPITARIISRPDLDSYTLKNPGEAEIKEKRLLHLDGQIWLANAPSWLFIRREIEQAGGRIIRTERRQVLQESVNDPGRRRYVEIACPPEARDAIHRVLLRQAFKDKDRTLYPKVSIQGDSITAEYVDRDEYTLADFHTDYRAGLLGKKAVAIIAFDPAKYDAGWQTEPATLKKWRRVYEGADSGNLVQVHHCPVCGEPAPVVPRSGRVDYYCPDCGSALYDFTRWRRTGLARLVQKKYRHFFKVYVADECFPGNTPIMTPDGVKAIREIRPGDQVLSYDGSRVVVKTVLNKFQSTPISGLVKVHHTGGELFCTPNHEIYADGKWVQAARLALGQTIIIAGSEGVCQGEKVISVQPIPCTEKLVYNLEVEDTHCYFASNILVSNCHKTKSGSTDLGTADQRFLTSIRFSLALTGTLFGGAAGSLFYLLYRRVPELRALYGFTEMNRWIDHYGLWEESWSQAERVETGVGASTGVKRWNYRRRELPGVSPAVIRFLLPITLFGNITDLGYELPPLYEDIVSVPMTAQQAAQYRDASRALLGAALELARVGDTGALSVWFNTVRFRPASAFRNEQVNYSGKKGGEIHFELPAVITRGEPWLPKERKLAEIVRANMDEGRKTLTFVEQTGTRDIRDRLRQALVHLVPGGKMTLVEVGSLSANSMAPAKREAWIKANAPSMDALLVNPRLIETGLDLLVFPDLVFYETTTSLYTMWQAMRRVWRLGQDREVHVRFLAYENTMEQVILERMGLKMKYAQLLYGESASGVLVEADGDDDIQREVIRDALQGKAFDSVGSAIRHVFGSGAERTTRLTTAPEGSVIAASPTITLVDLPSGEVMQLSLLPGFDPIRPMEIRRKRRKVVVLPAQLGIWGIG